MTSPADDGWLGRVRRALDDEFGRLRLRLLVFGMASRLAPPQYGNRYRALLARCVGFRIGSGTLLLGTPRIAGGRRGFARNLVIGRDCSVGVDCTFDLGAPLSIGDRVTIEHQVMILTTSHELGPREHRAGALLVAPVAIGDGAWLGARSIILPGVTVGEGAVVAPGALVNKDVAPHTKVAGAPARRSETLEP